MLCLRATEKQYCVMSLKRGDPIHSLIYHAHSDRLFEAKCFLREIVDNQIRLYNAPPEQPKNQSKATSQDAAADIDDPDEVVPTALTEAQDLTDNKPLQVSDDYLQEVDTTLQCPESSTSPETAVDFDISGYTLASTQQLHDMALVEGVYVISPLRNNIKDACLFLTAFWQKKLIAPAGYIYAAEWDYVLLEEYFILYSEPEYTQLTVAVVAPDEDSETEDSWCDEMSYSSRDDFSDDYESDSDSFSE